MKLDFGKGDQVEAGAGATTDLVLVRVQEKNDGRDGRRTTFGGNAAGASTSPSLLASSGAVSTAVFLPRKDA